MKNNENIKSVIVDKFYHQRLADSILKNINNCTNVEGIKSATNLDIRNEKDTLEFVTNYYSETAGLVMDWEEKYKFVKINGKYCPIDEPIADLIIELNAKGYKTLYSCCGHDIKKNNPTYLNYYIAFDFGEKTFTMLNKVYNLLTNNTEILPYINGNIHLSTIETNNSRFLLKTELKKRNIDFKLKNTKGNNNFWKQLISIKYTTKHRVDAINLINSTFRKAMYSI